jgi:hypothetical protein
MTYYIGLGHYKRTGKDTFANYLLKELKDRKVSAKKVPFAWKLKQICHELYEWAGLREPEFYDTPEGEVLREVKLERLVSEDRPEGLSPRDIWIMLGTNAVRENVYQRTWLDYVLQTDFGVDVVVIPDTRFPNEAEGIKDNKGILIKVVRPGFRPDDRNVPDHLNPDKALLTYDGWDYVLGASGDIRDLGEQAEQFADWIYGTGRRPRQSPAEMELALQVENAPAGTE